MKKSKFVAHVPLAMEFEADSSLTAEQLREIAAAVTATVLAKAEWLSSAAPVCGYGVQDVADMVDRVETLITTDRCGQESFIFAAVGIPDVVEVAENDA